jgi:phage-related protein
MLNETFFLDGMDARNMGIHLQKPFELDSAEPDIKKEKVSGRNGDFFFFSGSYKNRTGVASCFALSRDVIDKIDKINYWLLSNVDYRRLELSDDPNHYLMASVVNAASIAQRNRLLNPFEIEFDCKPQRFRKSGERTIRMVNNGILNNPGMISNPLITVTGKGNIALNVSGKIVEISNLNGKIVIDSEEQEAYNDIEIVNSQIYTEDFPVLNHGYNSISWDGNVESVEIMPRWWDL